MAKVTPKKTTQPKKKPVSKPLPEQVKKEELVMPIPVMPAVQVSKPLEADDIMTDDFPTEKNWPPNQIDILRQLAAGKLP